MHRGKAYAFAWRALLAALLSTAPAWAQPTPIIPDWFAARYPNLVKSRHFQEGLLAYKRHVGFGSPSSVPRDARIKARQISEAHALKPAAAGAALKGLPAVVAGNIWTNIGPAPELNGQIGTTAPSRNVSGRISAIAVDPTNTNHWYIGAASGGVWATTNAGANWLPLTDSQATTAIGALAIPSGAANIVYAGTGEGNNGGDNFLGQGLLKSTDGGTTWTLLGAANFAGDSFEALITSADGNTVLAATNRSYSGFLSVLAGIPVPAPPPTGIYQSTDGGHTWTLRRAGVGSGLAADPTNFANQYGALGDSMGNAGVNGLYRSPDSGTTWNPVPGPWGAGANVGRIAIAIAPSDRNTMYVSIQDATPGATFGRLLGLWVTTNAFAAVPIFMAINTNATDTGTGLGFCGWDAAFAMASNQCDYDMVLGVDPANPNLLYAGGIPLWQYNATTVTWTEVSHTAAAPANGIHADQHALAFTSSPLIVTNTAMVSGGGSAASTATDTTTILLAGPSTLLAGNDGGIWSSPDSGTTWNDVNGNLATMQSYYGAVNPGAGGFLLTTGMQDNGTASTTSNMIGGWPWISDGDGTGTAIASATNFAVSSANQVIQRTTDGVHFNLANGGIVTMTPAGVGLSFASAVVKCPGNNNTLLTSTNRLYRTTNFFTGAVPSPPAPALWGDNGAGVALPDLIRGMAFAPSDGTCNTYAFGSEAGAVFLTQNGGAAWTNIQGTLPGRGITALAFDPGNANILYVTIEGYSGAAAAPFGHVFRSTNALSPAPLWADVSPPVDIPFDSIAIAGAGGTIYAGCDMGVWTSSNSGAAWAHMGPAMGMPNVPVFDLEIGNGSLVAFTHGRGAFLLTVGAGAALSITKTHAGNFLQGQTGATYTIVVSNTGTGATSGTVTVTDAVPAGLAATAIAGTGWTCTQPAGPCSRSDALAAGASYPSLTLTVNVSSGAASPQVNSVTVSGGGSPNASATDSTIIVSSSTPVLSISKSHTGSFAQGQMGAAYSVTVSDAAGASAAGGTVTVTESLPSGLSLVSMSGSGWNCAANVCTRGDTLASGASYPAIAVTVNVASNASSPQVNAVSVSGGGSAAASATDPTVITTMTAGLGFFPVTPCRIADTRAGQGFTGQFGPPSMAANQTRTFTIPSSGCNIPSTAQAYSLNVTVVPSGGLGYLAIWPAGQAQPLVSTLNSLNGAVLANAAIVPAGAGGAVTVFVTNATDVIIDINGYFGPPAGTSALAFYPVTPCRVVDTRNGNGPFGGPSLPAGGTRSFAVPQSACGIPSTAHAYSLNMTVVPPGPLTYLTTWPTGQTQPVVSTLNALQGQIAANAAIVPAGTNGAISVFVSDASNVIVDINGYFAAPGSPGALYFYSLTPCRIADTRNAAGTFGGPSLAPGVPRSFPVPSSSCAVPSSAQAYSLNMTVVPPGPLLYLSTWPAGQTQPVVSTLNDLQGQIVANAAIVPAGVAPNAGAIAVFASDATNLVIDINGYFGQ